MTLYRPSSCSQRALFLNPFRKHRLLVFLFLLLLVLLKMPSHLLLWGQKPLLVSSTRQILVRLMALLFSPLLKQTLRVGRSPLLVPVSSTITLMLISTQSPLLFFSTSPFHFLVLLSIILRLLLPHIPFSFTHLNSRRFFTCVVSTEQGNANISEPF